MKLKPGLFLCAIAIAGLSGCGETQSQPVPAQTAARTFTAEMPTPTSAAAQTPAGDKGGLLVTQAEYDAALAKWDAQVINSYKMSVTVEAVEVPQPVLNGDWTVMVSNRGQKVQALSRPLGAPASDPANTEDLSYLTVERQFDLIKQWFGETTPSGTTRRATFDPTLGYPTLVEDRFGGTGSGNYIGGGGGISVTVHSLEVLETGAPKTLPPETPIPDANK